MSFRESSLKVGGRKAYVSGFLLSLALTLAAYSLVARHVHSHHRIYSDDSLIFYVLFLAMVQFFVQLVLFLHLGRESKPRLNLVAFWFMAGVVLILVVGSIWIMNHLNYNLMNPDQTNNYLIKDEGFGH